MFYGTGLFVAIASAIFCYRWSDTGDHNPLVWAAIGFFFPCIGLVACLVMVKR